MRSVTVVLPASMWAMMPMLRVRASDTCRAIWVTGLPLEVAEGLVGLGHLVRVFAALHSGTETVHSVHELVGELLAHRLALTLAGCLDEPANAERHAPIATNLDRDLVSRPTNAARLDLDDGRRVAQGSIEHFESRPA